LSKFKEHKKAIERTCFCWKRNPQYVACFVVYAVWVQTRGLSRSRRAAAAGKNGAPPPPIFLGPARRRRRRDFTGAPPTHSSVIEFLVGKT
jgi:hypothetical protein